ncbi:hypothetical protein GCM10023075_04060 [Streptosporangium album]
MRPPGHAQGACPAHRHRLDQEPVEIRVGVAGEHAVTPWTNAVAEIRPSRRWASIRPGTIMPGQRVSGPGEVGIGGLDLPARSDPDHPVAPDGDGAALDGRPAHGEDKRRAVHDDRW